MNNNNTRQNRKPTFIKYMMPYRHKLMVGMVCLIIAQGLGLVAPWLLKICIDSIGQGTASSLYLARFAGLLVGVALVALVFGYAMRMNLITASRDMEYDLRNDLFRHLQTLSASFFHTMKTGDIMARATNDVNYVRNFWGPGVMNIAGAIMIPFAVVLMFAINAQLALLAFIPLPIVTTLVYLLRTSVHARAERCQEQYSTMSALAQENFTGIRVVKSYAIEDREIAAFDAACMKYLNRNMSLARLDGLFHPLFGMVIGMVMTIIVTVGGRDVINGTMTLGDLTAFLSYSMMMMWPTAAIGWSVSLYQSGGAALARINQILTTEPEIADAPDALPGAKIAGEIEFRNVWFQYDGQNEPVLRDISLKIPKGATVAVVGRTGSGKSTLVNLVPRLLDPAKGAVLIDGQDVRNIPLQTLRHHVGFVPQETFLFSDTVRSNISYGVDGVPESEILNAGRLSHILEELKEFPHGLDTMLGERGVNISGGQKQRVTIGRALIKKPKILVLDDALSSVDTETEEKILHDLVHAVTDTTKIIISHRISTVKEADTIVVIDNGTIVASGTHDELLTQGGIYAGMYQKQLLEGEIEKE